MKHGRNRLSNCLQVHESCMADLAADHEVSPAKIEQAVV